MAVTTVHHNLHATLARGLDLVQAAHCMCSCDFNLLCAIIATITLYHHFLIALGRGEQKKSKNLSDN